MTEPADPHLDMDLPSTPLATVRSRTLGEQLRVAREARGLALPDIALRTRIPERTLAAIEADAYEQLPHPTFAAGFIRSLAREVGVGEDEAMARYRAENTRLPPPPSTPPLREIEPERVPSNRLAWVSGGVAALAILGAVIWFGRDRNAPPPPATTAVAAPNVAATAPAPVDPTAPAGAIPATTAPVPGSAPSGTVAVVGTPGPGVSPPVAAPLPVLGTPGGAVTLTATQDVWLQIKDKAAGTRLMSGILAQGQTYAVPAGDLQLWTGRAGALLVRVNGKLLPPLGGLAETVRSVDLAPAALVARTAGTPADAGAATTPTGPAAR